MKSLNNEDKNINKKSTVKWGGCVHLPPFFKFLPRWRQGQSYQSQLRREENNKVKPKRNVRTISKQKKTKERSLENGTF